MATKMSEVPIKMKTVFMAVIVEVGVGKGQEVWMLRYHLWSKAVMICRFCTGVVGRQVVANLYLRIYPVLGGDLVFGPSTKIIKLRAIVHGGSGLVQERSSHQLSRRSDGSSNQPMAMGRRGGHPGLGSRSECSHYWLPTRSGR